MHSSAMCPEEQNELPNEIDNHLVMPQTSHSVPREMDPTYERDLISPTHFSRNNPNDKEALKNISGSNGCSHLNELNLERSLFSSVEIPNVNSILFSRQLIYSVSKKTKYIQNTFQSYEVLGAHQSSNSVNKDSLREGDIVSCFSGNSEDICPPEVSPSREGVISPESGNSTQNDEGNEFHSRRLGNNIKRFLKDYKTKKRPPVVSLTSWDSQPLLCQKMISALSHHVYDLVGGSIYLSAEDSGKQSENHEKGLKIAHKFLRCELARLLRYGRGKFLALPFLVSFEDSVINKGSQEEDFPKPRYLSFPELLAPVSYIQCWDSFIRVLGVFWAGFSYLDSSWNRRSDPLNHDSTKGEVFKSDIPPLSYIAMKMWVKDILLWSAFYDIIGNFIVNSINNIRCCYYSENNEFLLLKRIVRSILTLDSFCVGQSFTLSLRYEMNYSRPENRLNFEEFKDGNSPSSATEADEEQDETLSQKILSSSTNPNLIPHVCVSLLELVFEVRYSFFLKSLYRSMAQQWKGLSFSYFLLPYFRAFLSSPSCLCILEIPPEGSRFISPTASSPQSSCDKPLMKNDTDLLNYRSMIRNAEGKNYDSHSDFSSTLVSSAHGNERLPPPLFIPSGVPGNNEIPRLPENNLTEASSLPVHSSSIIHSSDNPPNSTRLSSFTQSVPLLPTVSTNSPKICNNKSIDHFSDRVISPSKALEPLTQVESKSDLPTKKKTELVDEKQYESDGIILPDQPSSVTERCVPDSIRNLSLDEKQDMSDDSIKLVNLAIGKVLENVSSTSNTIGSNGEELLKTGAIAPSYGSFTDESVMLNFYNISVLEYTKLVKFVIQRERDLLINCGLESLSHKLNSLLSFILIDEEVKFLLRDYRYWMEYPEFHSEIESLYVFSREIKSLSLLSHMNDLFYDKLHSMFMDALKDIKENFLQGLSTSESWTFQKHSKKATNFEEMISQRYKVGLFIENRHKKQYQYYRKREGKHFEYLDCYRFRNIPELDEKFGSYSDPKVASSGIGISEDVDFTRMPFRYPENLFCVFESLESVMRHFLIMLRKIFTDAKVFHRHVSFTIWYSLEINKYFSSTQLAELLAFLSDYILSPVESGGRGGWSRDYRQFSLYAKDVFLVLYDGLPNKELFDQIYENYFAQRLISGRFIYSEEMEMIKLLQPHCDRVSTWNCMLCECSNLLDSDLEPINDPLSVNILNICERFTDNCMFNTLNIYKCFFERYKHSDHDYFEKFFSFNDKKKNDIIAKGMRSMYPNLGDLSQATGWKKTNKIELSLDDSQSQDSIGKAKILPNSVHVLLFNPRRWPLSFRTYVKRLGSQVPQLSQGLFEPSLSMFCTRYSERFPNRNITMIPAFSSGLVQFNPTGAFLFVTHAQMLLLDELFGGPTNANTITNKGLATAAQDRQKGRNLIVKFDPIDGKLFSDISFGDSIIYSGKPDEIEHAETRSASQCLERNRFTPASVHALLQPFRRVGLIRCYIFSIHSQIIQSPKEDNSLPHSFANKDASYERSPGYDTINVDRLDGNLTKGKNTVNANFQNDTEEDSKMNEIWMHTILPSSFDATNGGKNIDVIPNSEGIKYVIYYELQEDYAIPFFDARPFLPHDLNSLCSSQLNQEISLENIPKERTLSCNLQPLDGIACSQNFISSLSAERLANIWCGLENGEESIFEIGFNSNNLLSESLENADAQIAAGKKQKRALNTHENEGYQSVDATGVTAHQVRQGSVTQQSFLKISRRSSVGEIFPSSVFPAQELLSLEAHIVHFLKRYSFRSLGELLEDANTVPRFSMRVNITALTECLERLIDRGFVSRSPDEANTFLFVE